MSQRHGRAWFWAAWAALLPVLIFPIGDPDLWWHLSAARWMVERRALPRADWLSYILAGRPWVDFEWLAQLIFSGVYSAAGLAGLWLLKAALLAAAGGLLFSLLGELEIARPWRAAGLALWGAAMVPRSDIRTELFSLLFFAWLLREVLAGRKPRLIRIFLVFLLWANLHAGFVYGLLLLALCFAGEALGAGSEHERRDARLARARAWALAAGAGIAGTMVNPYGISIYSVLWRHAREVGNLRPFIREWAGLDWAPAHWPAWIILALAAFITARFWLKGGRSSPQERIAPHAVTLVLLAFAAMAVRHARVLPFFVTVAVPAGLVLGEGRRGAAGINWGACAATAAACAAFSLWLGWPLGVFRRVAHDRYWPTMAAAYLDQSADLAGKRIYNPWGWGGYLGFKLYPKYRVFQDGRYIFHPLLAEAGAAVDSPREWASFLDRYRVDVAVLENLPLRLDMPRRYPDGHLRAFHRPYYIAYMKREHWALVHWDDKALIFARRASFPAERLRALEYTLARPGDDEALRDALERREIDTKILRAELARHERELGSLVDSQFR